MLRIGIIGSKVFWETISVHFPLFPDVQFISFQYQQPEKRSILALVEEANCKVDLIIFAGSIPNYYGQAKAKELSIESIVVPFDDLGLALSVLRASHSLPFNQISIDLPNQEQFLKLVRVAKIPGNLPFVKDFPWIYEWKEQQHELNLDEFIKFHLQLYEERKTQLALTSIHAVYQELQKLDIPSSYMVVTNKSLIETLERAVSTFKLKKIKESQIAVVSIQSSNEDIQRDLELSEWLMRVSKVLLGKVESNQQQPYLIYTTRGALLGVEAGDFQQLLKEVERVYQTPFQVGVGYGYSIQEATKHSSQALFFTKSFLKDESIVCLVDEDNKLHGPLFERNQQVELINHNEMIQEIANELKMSAKNIKLIHQFIKLRHNRAFSATDLAEYMNLSRRSAERIIKRLITEHYLKPSGEEHSYTQGRPRKLYCATEKVNEL